MLFDQAYFERGATDGFTGRQFVKQQGAFKTPFQQGGSDTWIASVNTEFDLPIGLPLSLFASAGFVPVTTGHAGWQEREHRHVLRRPASVYRSCAMCSRSGSPWSYPAASRTKRSSCDRQVTDRVRFVFALENMDPTKLLRKLKPLMPELRTR